uniref:Secreted protein n=1 Tax=Steinernema glaseri TaxID=37863 RepID=A0A1I7YA54_9BILA
MKSLLLFLLPLLFVLASTEPQGIYYGPEPGIYPLISSNYRSCDSAVPHEDPLGPPIQGNVGLAMWRPLLVKRKIRQDKSSSIQTNRNRLSKGDVMKDTVAPTPNTNGIDVS